MASLRFAVRVKPGAKRDVVGGRWDGALGAALVVAVSAPAVDGRANDAVCRVLADAFAVRARAITVVNGLRSRDKLVEVDDAPDGSEDRLGALRCAGIGQQDRN